MTHLPDDDAPTSLPTTIKDAEKPFTAVHRYADSQLSNFLLGIFGLPTLFSAQDMKETSTSNVKEPRQQSSISNRAGSRDTIKSGQRSESSDTIRYSPCEKDQGKWAIVIDSDKPPFLERYQCQDWQYPWSCKLTTKPPICSEETRKFFENFDFALHDIAEETIQSRLPLARILLLRRNIENWSGPFRNCESIPDENRRRDQLNWDSFWGRHENGIKSVSAPYSPSNGAEIEVERMSFYPIFPIANSRLMRPHFPVTTPVWNPFNTSDFYFSRYSPVYSEMYPDFANGSDPWGDSFNDLYSVPRVSSPSRQCSSLISIPPWPSMVAAQRQFGSVMRHLAMSENGENIINPTHTKSKESVNSHSDSGDAVKREARDARLVEEIEANLDGSLPFFNNSVSMGMHKNDFLASSSSLDSLTESVPMQSKVLSTLTTSSRTCSPNGSVVTRVLMKKHLADGREESSESVRTFYSNECCEPTSSVPETVAKVKEKIGRTSSDEHDGKHFSGWFWC